MQYGLTKLAIACADCAWLLDIVATYYQLVLETSTGYRDEYLYDSVSNSLICV